MDKGATNRNIFLAFGTMLIAVALLFFGNISNPVYFYVVSIILGISTAIFVSSIMASVAEYSGVLLNGNLRVSGAFLIVLIVAIVPHYLLKQKFECIIQLEGVPNEVINGRMVSIYPLASTENLKVNDEEIKNGKVSFEIHKNLMEEAAELKIDGLENVYKYDPSKFKLTNNRGIKVRLKLQDKYKKFTLKVINNRAPGLNLKRYCFDVNVTDLDTKRVCTNEFGQVTIDLVNRTGESNFNPFKEVLINLGGFDKIGVKIPPPRSFKIIPGNNKVADPIKL